MADDGWVVTPKLAPPELAEDFHAEPYTSSEPLHASSHIRDWASFAELVGHDGLKLLMARASIGEPDVGA